MTYDQFILFGDSITQCSTSPADGFVFQAELQEIYCRRLDVINRGFSGYTTAHAIKVFPGFFPTPQRATVKLMTVFFGANDACLPGTFQHVPLDKYKENLKQLIQHPMVTAQGTKIIVITPPAVNEYQMDPGDGTPLARTASHTKIYADAAREIATSSGIPVADAWTAFMTAAGWKEGDALVGSKEIPNNTKLESLLTDGLHLTTEGYRLLFEVVMETIRKNYPGLSPEELPWVYPPWREAPRD
ncbi:SGNH hydrolase-type esterase domain-containing protein [Aspergillus ambiguus]|uniref:SGNH/GDSL hydrolase family protein n=1 Tax=Aspergillus ambiguus TaxID=176160 RepID=UPI003CCC9B0D